MSRIVDVLFTLIIGRFNKSLTRQKILYSRLPERVYIMDWKSKIKNLKSKILQSPFGLLLVCLLAGHAVLHGLWTTIDSRPPAWDETHHLRIALDYQASLNQGDWGCWLRPVYSNYPPLYHLGLGLLLPEADGKKQENLSVSKDQGQAPGVNETVDQVVWVNFIYLGVLVFCLFWLGRRFCSQWAGISAAVLGSFYVGMLFLLRRPMIDLPLAALVSLAYVCVLGGEAFGKRFFPADKRSGLLWGGVLGLVCGLGLMLKWSFVVYAGLPVAWAVWQWFRSKQWQALGVFLGVLFLAAGPWYILNGLPSFLRILKLTSLKESGDPHVWTWAGWFWYVKGVWLQQILWPLGIPFAAGLWVCWKRRLWVLLVWVFVPLVLFTLIQNKDLRYYVPCLPALAVVSVLGADLFVKRMWKFVWWGGWGVLAVLFGLVYEFGYCFPGFVQKSVGVKDYAVAEDWKIEEIVGVLSEGKDFPFDPAQPKHGRTPSTRSVLIPPHSPHRTDLSSRRDMAMGCEVAQGKSFPSARGVAGNEEIEKAVGAGLVSAQLIGNHAYFHQDLFRLYKELRGIEDIFVTVPKRRLGEFADFILYKTENMGPGFTLGYLNEAKKILDERPLWFEKTFSVAKEWDLPDGSQAVLFVRDVKESMWPLGLGEVELRLDHFPLPRFEAKGLLVRLVPGHPDEIKRGKFSKIIIECEHLDYRGLVLNEVALICHDVQVNLPKLFEEKEIYFVSAGGIQPQLRIGSDTFVNYLKKKALWLKEPEVRLEDEGIRVCGKAKWVSVDVSVRAGLTSDKTGVQVRLASLKIARIPFPVWLLGPFREKNFVLHASRKKPFPVLLNNIMIEDGVIKID